MATMWCVMRLNPSIIAHCLIITSCVCNRVAVYDEAQLFTVCLLQGPRGRGGVPQRGGARGGAPMAARGMRGARGGGLMRGAGAAGRGARGAIRGGPPLRGGAKRKLVGGDYNMTQTKKRNTQDNWGAQPIAQQPLNDSQWYQDSYGQQQWG